MHSKESKKVQQLLEWIIPLANLLIASINWSWWLEGKPYNLFLALFMVFCMVAFAYENGFKYFKLRQQRTLYFMLAFIGPLIFAVLGGLAGFLNAHVA